MLERTGRYWRICATGLSFAAFGVGGLAMRVLLVPLLNLLIWKRQLRIRLARSMIRVAFRGFVGLMRGLGVLRYRITGLERLQRSGLLILANHPTLIDTVFLMAFVKRADCIVKSELWNNPFTHGPVRAAGYIRNDSGIGMLDDCIASLGCGNNLIVFPEGTRTLADGEVRLKRGAANIAVRGATNVTPVLIRCTPPTLGKGGKWWRVPPRRAQFNIHVQEDIDVRPFIAAAGSETLAARHLTEYLEDYFNKEGKAYAAA
jgi:1-acyl-sn-glycerol-3-phosphate acyltransferase